ncbi:MAG: DNA polymerase/3'-5' exonuclease PolX [Syntrophomonadaceae bacterium]|nr:DNA polymerase/3'-5' exonuclease PolX [Syntrophomonadaceae bacterium]
MVDNREVAAILEEVANILEILGDNPYKIRAYRRASQTICELGDDLEDIWRQGKLRTVDGIGKALQSKIEEILQTGSLKYHQELLDRVPRGVLRMLELPGLGPRTVKVIYEHLGITNLDDLLEAAKARKIRELPGLGAKTEYNIKKGIEMLESIGETVTLGTVLPVARDFCTFLKDGEGIETAELVGSIRRRKPVVHDIDILAASNEPEKVRERVARYRRLKALDETGNGVIRGRIGLGFKFEVIVVSPSDFPLALLLTTGSKEHREVILNRMREAGVASGSSEAEIYEKLGMQWIPPELRENRGEIEQAAARRLPLLVNQSEIKGDLHLHTDWTDGAHSLEQMVEQARAMGYSYIAVTDHSQSLKISKGLDEKRLRDQMRLIARMNEEMTDFRILSGIEVDIFRDGTLDFPDEILEQLDVVVASIHSAFHLSPEEQTHRIIKAIENPNVDIIGHLTGRLLTRRAGYQVDIDKVLKAASRRGTILEINAHPDRLDISEEVVMQARKEGVKVAINSDAHQAGDMMLIEYGIYNARRGWLEADDVVNTWSLDRLLQYLENKPL